MLGFFKDKKKRRLATAPVPSSLTLSDPEPPRPGTSASPHPTPASALPVTPPSATPLDAAAIARPRTAGVTFARPPDTARPDTGASEIGPLPEQTFFPEAEGFDEDDDEPEEGVFAFKRPITSAQSGVAFSDYSTSVPPTGVPPTPGGLGFAGAGILRRGSRDEAAVVDSRRGSQVRRGSGDTQISAKDVPPPTGVIDVGGRLPEVAYDPANPPPFSGRHNPNNSSFAFMNRLLEENAVQAQSPTLPQREPVSRRPFTGTLLDRLHNRRRNHTGTTATTTATTSTTATEFTNDLTTETSRTSDESGDLSDAGSSMTGATRSRPSRPRRVKSTQPLIPSTAGGDSFMTDSDARSRGYSRGSYGMTEISGDMTVADGKTTYGDGAGGYLKEEADVGLDVLVEEDSPYPEVRASVSNIDDPEMPALTLRSWTMGMFFVIIGSAVNTFFHFRTPAPYVSPLIVQVVAYPVGKFLAWCLPIRDFHLPRFLGGMSFTLNPGPFNIKEHTIIVIMANVAIGPAYALYATVTSELYYDHDFGAGFSILFVLTTQVTGFAFAGMARRFVVWPASMIWPGNLVVATNLNTFHAEDDGFTGGMSRYRFLMVGMAASFAYYFLPGFLFTALSYFSYACWIAPNNRVVNELFGSATGLGMGILTFDWSQVTWIGSPLTTPWWAEVNVGLGFVLFYWILVPILYYNNVWQTAYLPMNVIQTADRFGDSYDIFNILTPSIELNLTAYAEYSPIYLSASFSMTYMLAFALSTALIVHTALHHGPRIYRAIINVKTEADDVHMKLMRAYPEVPHWWYVAIFAVCFIMAVVAIEVFHTGLPVWGYILCVILPFIYVIPAAFIYAMTSQLIAINLLAELIPGYIFQGQPIPGMIFKVFSVQTVTETLTFLQDQKLGHYMKIPPRATFFAQLSATSVTCLIQIATKVILFKTVPDICSSTQKHLLTCASTKVFFTSTVVWGLIGPERLFSRGAMFYPQTYAALAGALLPIPLWLWVRRWPRSIFRNVNLPVIFNGALAIPPATGVNYASWLVTGFIFQFWIRRRNFAWWSKYNYVLSAALDVGTAMSAVVIFLVLDLPGASLNWWGNTVYKNTVDWSGYGASYLTPPATGFGPDTWKL